MQLSKGKISILCRDQLIKHFDLDGLLYPFDLLGDNGKKDKHES